MLAAATLRRLMSRKATSSPSRFSSSNKATSFVPATRLRGFLTPTVWHEFTPLAASSGAVNLGQGFPGWEPPQFVRDAMKTAVESGANQYTRSAGHPGLVSALAARYSARLGREVDGDSEVVVCNGATQALFSVMQGLVEPGDEVIVFEPAFDIYHADVDVVGGRVRGVPIRLDEESGERWVVDFNELEEAFTDKTRVLLLNTPHNPTGKVFTRSELERVAELVKAHPDVVVVCDEVYDELTFGEHRHVHFASLPGMWERTLTVNSAGKTFSVTGWKIGWAIGPAHLIKPVQISHQWVAFSVSTPGQAAIASCIERAEQEYESEPSYYHWLRAEYGRKRDILCKGLQEAGLRPIHPEGSFFVMADTSALQVPQEYLDDKSVSHDWALCRWLTKDVGVAAIPPSAFYSEENKHLARNLARFAFCKDDDELLEGMRRLKERTAGSEE